MLSSFRVPADKPEPFIYERESDGIFRKITPSLRNRTWYYILLLVPSHKVERLC